MTDLLDQHRKLNGLDRPGARTRILSARFTHGEYSELEKFAWSKGVTLSDWVHQTLVEGARGAGSSEMDAHIFIELVGIQMLLMATLEPLLHGETRTADQVANLFRQIQTTKVARAQELLAKRSQKKETP
jgi:hypothetical protein